MPGKILVGYDGSEASERALAYAVEHAKIEGATIVLAHVLEWSPYAFLTPQEIEERHARRTKELARAESAILQPVSEQLSGSGVTVETELKYGHIAETLCAIAEAGGVGQIVIGRMGHSSMATRIFGSVASSLAQASPVPVTIVP
jgi:nucleotide-binding universal stress UspA family protein